MTQRYRYEVTSVWGSMENNDQVKVGTILIDVDKNDPDFSEDEVQWDIWNYDQHKITGGFTGKKLGPFEESSR